MSAATPEVRGPPPDSASPSIALPRIKPELGLNDATLFAVYCFIKNFIGKFSIDEFRMQDIALLHSQSSLSQQRKRKSLAPFPCGQINSDRR
ncbi:unnamed protein product [Pieris brassicae]|uniref:Uncharacterized protein n=1 Tax=Pieris brassicae TaxID=7116 RepID=A0A9P0T1I3_PIEBR|nr:unnamed protein product [Pieris brassicae]